MPLTLNQLSEVNRERAAKLFHSERKDVLYWSNAVAGEAGELANVVKKLYRDSEGKLDARYLRKIKEEAGGQFIYLDLLLNSIGVSLEECITYEFDRVSRKASYPVLLGQQKPVAVASSAKAKKIIKHISWMERIGDFIAEELEPDEWADLGIDRYVMLVDDTPTDDWFQLVRIFNGKEVFFELDCRAFTDWGNVKKWDAYFKSLRKTLDVIKQLQQPQQFTEGEEQVDYKIGDTGIILNAENESALIASEKNSMRVHLDPSKVWPEGDGAADRMREWVSVCREVLPECTIGADIWMALEDPLPNFHTCMSALFEAAGERKVAFCMDGVKEPQKEFGLAPKQTVAYFQLRSPKAYGYKLMEKYLRMRAPRVYVFNNFAYFKQWPNALKPVRDTLQKVRLPQ